jgi:hypothetical protein
MAKKYDKPLPQWELNRQIIDEVYWCSLLNNHWVLIKFYRELS